MWRRAWGMEQERRHRVGAHEVPYVGRRTQEERADSWRWGGSRWLTARLQVRSKPTAWEQRDPRRSSPGRGSRSPRRRRRDQRRRSRSCDGERGSPGARAGVVVPLSSYTHPHSASLIGTSYDCQIQVKSCRRSPTGSRHVLTISLPTPGRCVQSMSSRSRRALGPGRRPTLAGAAGGRPAVKWIEHPKPAREKGAP